MYHSDEQLTPVYRTRTPDNQSSYSFLLLLFFYYVLPEEDFPESDHYFFKRQGRMSSRTPPLDILRMVFTGQQGSLQCLRRVQAGGDSGRFQPFSGHLVNTALRWGGKTGWPHVITPAIDLRSPAPV